MDDLTRTTLDLFSLTKTCANCWHNREGHCSLYSCECATDTRFPGRLPRRWTSYEEGQVAEAQVLGARVRR